MIFVFAFAMGFVVHITHYFLTSSNSFSVWVRISSSSFGFQVYCCVMDFCVLSLSLVYSMGFFCVWTLWRANITIQFVRINCNYTFHAVHSRNIHNHFVGCWQLLSSPYLCSLLHPLTAVAAKLSNAVRSCRSLCNF